MNIELIFHGKARQLLIALCLTLCLPCTSFFAQNVGIGTIAPQHKLDVRTRIDTTLHIRSVGQGGLTSTEATRIGILNVMDSTTAGSRIGMLTKIAFPNSVVGASYNYIGHEIGFDGFCFPIGSGCNESDIYGLKIDIPIFANDGTHYGIYSSTPRLTGYAGFFDGRGHFSRMVGIGVEPNNAQNLYVRAESTSIVPMTRAGRFTMLAETTSNNVEAILAETLGNSTGINYGGVFKTTAYTGEGIGVYAQAFSGGGGDSYAVSAKNISTTGVYRKGITAEVSGNGPGVMLGIEAIITGTTTNNRPVYGMVSTVEQFSTTSSAYGIRAQIDDDATTGNSYALYGVNNDGGYSAFLVGRARVQSGEDASLATDGFLQLGTTNGLNVVYDDNEIIARNNGVAAPLFLQHSSGDVMLCGLDQGAVAIGITSAANIPEDYLLAVDGKGIFEELRVELSGTWPDYVFQDEYDLMPLGEVKSYIDTHGHLPNVPSANSIDKEGLLLGEMQRRTMEKLEELTLYILKQQEEIDALKEALKNR